MAAHAGGQTPSLGGVSPLPPAPTPAGPCCGECHQRWPGLVLFTSSPALAGPVSRLPVIATPLGPGKGTPGFTRSMSPGAGDADPCVHPLATAEEVPSP